MPTPLIFGIRFEVWMVGLTIAIALTAVIQALIYGGMHKTSKRVERAYVTLSHLPPGFEFRTPEDQTQVSVGVNVKAENHGSTPARITYYMLTTLWTDEGLPSQPPDDPKEGKRIAAHLVKGPSLNLFANFGYDVAKIQEIKTAKPGGIELFLIGYVDYIDAFGKRYRSGYARVYKPSVDDRTNHTKPDSTRPISLTLSGLRVLDADAYDRRNNLTFVTQSGYNYDRERAYGEGYDWQDPD